MSAVFSIRDMVVVCIGVAITMTDDSFAEGFLATDRVSEYTEFASAESSFAVLGRWGGGPCYCSAANDEIVCLGNGAYLDIVDFSNPSAPVLRGRLLTPATIYGLELVGEFAFVANHTGGLRVVDIRAPHNPIEVGWCPEILDGDDIEVHGDLAYVADFGHGLRVVDVSDPYDLTIIGTLESPLYPTGLAVEGGCTYLADEYFGFYVVDVSDPVNPAVVGHPAGVTPAYQVSLSGTLALVANGIEGFSIVDVTDQASPLQIGSYDGGFVLDVVPYIGYAFLACHFHGLRVVDFLNPGAIQELASVRMEGHPDDITLQGARLYSANKHGGLAAVDISNPQNPILAGVYPTADVAWDLDVVDDIAYVADGQAGMLIIDFYSHQNPRHIGTYDNDFTVSGIAVRGKLAYLVDHTGLRVIDVRDPTSPIEIGYCPTPGWAVDVAVSGDCAYVADERKGLRILDVSDPQMPAEIGAWEFGGFSHAAGVCVSAGHAYVAAGDSGLRILDIACQESPVEVGVLASGGITYDVAVQGAIAYVTGVNWMVQPSGLLWVVDVSDPARPLMISQYQYPGIGRRATTYAHIVLIAAEHGGVIAVDVLDPFHPMGSGSCLTGGNAYGIDVEEDIVYVADGTDGVYLLDYTGSVVADVPGRHPTDIALTAHPNPFSSHTAIGFTLPESQEMDLSIHDVMGRRVRTLFTGMATTGRSMLVWHARDDRGAPVANGGYVIRLRAGNLTQQQQIVLLR